MKNLPKTPNICKLTDRLTGKVYSLEYDSITFGTKNDKIWFKYQGHFYCLASGWMLERDK